MPPWTFADVHGGPPKCALSWDDVDIRRCTFAAVSVALLPRLLPRRPDRFVRQEVTVPRGPRGKRVTAGDGYSVAGKNSNGVGSVYFEPPSTRADGTVVKGRWRATYVDLDGKIKRVSGPTRALAESRRTSSSPHSAGGAPRPRQGSRSRRPSGSWATDDSSRLLATRFVSRRPRPTGSRLRTSSTSSAARASSTSGRRC